MAQAAVLSHVEVMHRPGDRALAMALFEALGCRTIDTGTMSPAGSSYISVHPDPDDRGLDNVLYLSEMPADQARLEEVLRQRLESDGELRGARDRYRAMAGERPYGLSHIALRYPTFAGLEERLADVIAFAYVHGCEQRAVDDEVRRDREQPRARAAGRGE